MAEKVIIDLEVKSNKGVKNVEKLNTEISKTNKEVKKTNEELAGATNTLDKFTGGAVSKIKNFGSSIKGLTTGFKSLRVAIIGTGIGALIIALVSLRAAFTSSEEGQNKFAKLMGVIGSVTGNLVDMLANLGESIINAFTNPKQALIDFKNLIVENITNRFNAIIDTLGFLGSAFKKVFSGDFKGALEDAKSAGSSYIDSLTGVEDSINKVTEATKGLVTELKEEAKIAGQIADQRAKADKLERTLIVERAEADRKVAELREQAADKDKVSAKDRIIALEEAGRISEEITNKEIVAARLRFEARVEENKLSKSTKADLDEEANLKARLIQLETARLKQQKSITAEISGARKEEKARIEAEEKEQIIKDKEVSDKKLADEKALAELKKQIRDSEAVTEDERRALEIIKVTEHYDKLIALAQAQGLSTVALEQAKSNSLNKINQTNSKNEIDWENITTREKTKIIQQGLGNLATILGKESAAGKAAAIANATISTFQSATDSYKSLAGIPIIGPALGFAAAGAAVASGFAQVKSITATKIPTLAGKSAPSVGGGTPSAPSISAPPSVPSLPPAFNVVGASGTSQLADAIGGQSQQPIQAYVVSNDVTTAQEMDRNIVTGASIG
jgi:hypothetical protein